MKSPNYTNESTSFQQGCYNNGTESAHQNHETNEMSSSYSMSFSNHTCSSSKSENHLYEGNVGSFVTITQNQQNTMIEQVALWFLNKSSMTNKKLQKLCYYAYCWYIVFFNDIEAVSENNLNVLSSEKFQAWIHGPVSPLLYRKYKEYGWHDIPQAVYKPQFPPHIESLLEQVWHAYGNFSADQLEAISHNETPWQNARKNANICDACANEISGIHILHYYSNLGK